MTAAAAMAGGVSVFAPAKVNLTLHVTGQRDDGYHLLDSLVAFGGLGDVLALLPAQESSFRVTGPQARGVPTDAQNLVTKTVSRFPGSSPLSITLVKRLPTAAGLGGGSADAAAVLRGLAAMGALGADLAGAFASGLAAPGALMKAAAAHGPEIAALGADVPMCLFSTEARVRGIGDHILTLGSLPPMPAVLVNPGVAVSTPQVFAGLVRKANPPMPEALPNWQDLTSFAEWLAAQRNDLEAPAKALTPVIGDVIDALGGSEDCLLARMSGSGATCFGLFPDEPSARAAATAITIRHPDWWVVPMVLGGQAGRAMPVALKRQAKAATNDQDGAGLFADPRPKASRPVNGKDKPRGRLLN